MSTTALLDERGTTHGKFSDNARHGQHLRHYFRQSPHWDKMAFEHCEALDMIACKLSRILSGQSSFRDHWHDIAGYAELAAKATVSYDDRQLANGYKVTATDGLGRQFETGETITVPSAFPMT